MYFPCHSEGDWWWCCIPPNNRYAQIEFIIKIIIRGICIRKTNVCRNNNNLSNGQTSIFSFVLKVIKTSTCNKRYDILNIQIVTDLGQFLNSSNGLVNGFVIPRDFKKLYT